MAYKYDSKNVGTTSIIPEGNFECVISDAKTMTSSVKGTPGINLTLTVRNDVEQECKNRTMFDTFWLSDKARPYSEKKMNTISTCGNFENGREFDSDDAWCAEVVGVAALVVVKHRFDDYAGEEKANVSYYKRTEQPEVKHVWKDGTAPASGGYVEVSTDDLPF